MIYRHKKIRHTIIKTRHTTLIQKINNKKTGISGLYERNLYRIIGPMINKEPFEEPMITSVLQAKKYIKGIINESTKKD